MNYNRELLITGPRVYKILEISQIISQASILQGLEVKTAEFTNEPLMFSEIVHIRMGKEIYSPLIIKNKADILVCFEPLLALELVTQYSSSVSMIILNTHSILPFIHQTEQAISIFEQLAEKIIKVDIFQIAKEAGNINKNNFVMLGILDGLNILPIDSVNIIKAVEDIVDQHDIINYVKLIEMGKGSASLF